MEALSDPEHDRAIKDIVPPPHRPISDELLYPNKGTYKIEIDCIIETNLPNWEELRKHLN